MISLTDLAASALEKTRAGKLIWSELGPDAFVANIGDNSVMIRSRANRFELTFRDSVGRVLDRMDSDSPGVTQQIIGIQEELYELARRQALKVDEALMEIKRKLDTL
jgi:hypothetical protein